MLLPGCLPSVAARSVSQHMLALHCRSPDGVPSVILVAAQVVFHGPPGVRAPLLPALIGALVPWAMTHHHALRSLSQLVLQVQAPHTVDLSLAPVHRSELCPGYTTLCMIVSYCEFPLVSLFR